MCREPARRWPRHSSWDDGSSEGSSREGTDDRPTGDGVLVVDLTVVSRGERVPFVSWGGIQREERGRGRRGARRADREDGADGCSGHHRRRAGDRGVRRRSPAAAPGHLTMTKVRCPDCSEMVELPQSVRSGDLVECPNCAGHVLRVREVRDAWGATLAHRVLAAGPLPV
jgi:DNA-directed RNA polymerase subunit RPC12/RpoP